MPSRPLSITLLAAVLVGGTALGPVEAASAATHAKTYANCAAVHRVYSGGIAKKGVTRNRTTSGSRALKGKVKFDTALYTANRKSDRDEDGIACEPS